MPWTVDNPPNPAKNASAKEKRACVAAANAAIKKDPDDESGAIQACIGAMKKVKSKGEFRMSQILSVAERQKQLAMLIDKQRNAGNHKAELRSSGMYRNPSLLDVKEVAKFSNKEKAADLHGASRKGIMVEMEAAGEFGLVIEEGFWTSYAGPFPDQETARETAVEIIEDFALVGTQVFIVQDTAVLRKDFDTSDDSDE